LFSDNGDVSGRSKSLNAAARPILEAIATHNPVNERRGVAVNGVL